MTNLKDVLQKVEEINRRLTTLEQKKMIDSLSSKLRAINHRLDHFGEDVTLTVEDPEMTEENLRRDQLQQGLNSMKWQFSEQINARIAKIQNSQQSAGLTKSEVTDRIDRLKLAKLQVGNALNAASEYIGNFHENFYLSLHKDKATRILSDAMMTDEQIEAKIWNDPVNQQIQDFNSYIERQKKQ